MRVLLRGGGTDSLSIGKCIAQSIYLPSLFHLIRLGKWFFPFPLLCSSPKSSRTFLAGHRLHYFPALFLLHVFPLFRMTVRFPAVDSSLKKDSNNLNPCAFIAENKDGKTPVVISKELGHAESVELVSELHIGALRPSAKWSHSPSSPAKLMESYHQFLSPKLATQVQNATPSSDTFACYAFRSTTGKQKVGGHFLFQPYVLCYL